MYILPSRHPFALVAFVFSCVGLSAAVPTVAKPDWPGTRVTRFGSGAPIVIAVGYPFEYQIKSGGSPTTFSAPGLPPGLLLNRSTGLITGRPQTAGSYSVTLSAENTDGVSAPVTASLVVQPAPTQPPVITTSSTFESPTYGGPIDRHYVIGGFTIQASNVPTAYAATGLPPGVEFDASYGEIWYRYESDISAGVYNVALSATNAIGTGTATLRWIVRPRVRRVTVDNTSPLLVGDALGINFIFDAPIVVTGAPWVELRWGTTSARATYRGGSGTNTLQFIYRPAVADAHLEPTTVSPFIILDGASLIHPSGAPAIPYPPSDVRAPLLGGIHLPASVISNAGALTAQVGTPFSYSVQATYSPKQYRLVSGSLPAGLTLDTATGILSGTPTQISAVSFVLSATNGFEAPGATPPTASFTIDVNGANSPPPPTNPPPSSPPPPPSAGGSAPAPQTISFAPVPAPAVGQPLTLAATASSGLPITLTLVSGNATLSGTQLTPHGPGTVVVRASQAGSATFAVASADLTLTVGRATQSIEFVSPVSAIVMGTPILLSASTSSGLPITFTVVSGNASLSGNALTVTGSGPVVVRAAQAGNDAYSPVSTEITLTGAVRARQTIALASLPAELLSDRILPLAATASSGLGVAFEVVSGPAVIRDGALVPTAASGTVVVRATQSGNAVTEPAETTAIVDILPASRLINLSTRGAVQSGTQPQSLIAGFVVTGPSAKRLLVRGIGPTLTTFAVPGAASNPGLRILDSGGRLVADNDDWFGTGTASTAARLGAFALPADSRDAALLITLPPGAYSLHVASTGASRGVVLAEIYDASDTPALETQQLINLSTRGFLDAGEPALNAGFVVAGSGSKRLLIRGIGPGLAPFGVAGTIADPVLTLSRGTATLATNDNWHTPVSTIVESISTPAEILRLTTDAGAFPLPANSADAALLVVLPPGAYTATVTDAQTRTGIALVEIYQLP